MKRMAKRLNPPPRAGLGHVGLLKHNRYKGFTLAEALIALVIIGIIAAITVPNLITAYQKQETVERLKKTFSALSQTTNRAIADNGPIGSWDVLELSSEEFARKYLMPYLSVIKSCPSAECSFDYMNLNGGEIRHPAPGYGYYVLYLADGTILSVGRPLSNEWGISVSILADINGERKPNVMGKDVFYFIYWLNEPARFIPYGGGWTRNILIGNLAYACRKDKTGDICAALIMADGWKISDDYPW